MLVQILDYNSEGVFPLISPGAVANIVHRFDSHICSQFYSSS